MHVTRGNRIVTNRNEVTKQRVQQTAQYVKIHRFTSITNIIRLNTTVVYHVYAVYH